MSDAAKSVVFVQYAGDYAEAFRRLDSGGAETYYAQRYSIDAVSAQVGPTTAVATICCTADRDEDCILDNGVRSISLHSPDGVDESRVWRAINSCEPTHVCFRTPLQGVLRRALQDAAIQSVLLTLADSFSNEGLRGRLRAWRLRRLLNHRKVVAVGNHGRNASASLRLIGIDPSRIVPWDWPHAITPHQSAPKEAPISPPWHLMFIGLLTESKGLGDLMRAVRKLKDDGTTVCLSYAGRGEAETFAALAKTLGIDEQVKALGLVAHSAVVPLMRDADLVVIPSRHEYPEGFPMTIYEALCSRTPIIASDHPMYAHHLSSTGAALVFPARNHDALAQSITAAMTDPGCYRQLSAASASAWDQLQLPVTWGKMVSEWVTAVPGKRPDFLVHALAPRAAT